MYAVIRTGGKQYRVSEGDILRIEKINNAIGETLTITEVLMLGGDKPKIGNPLVDKASVEAEVVDQYKAKKINIIKFKRRKHYLKNQGHRQLYTKIKINKINTK